MKFKDHYKEGSNEKKVVEFESLGSTFSIVNGSDSGAWLR